MKQAIMAAALLIAGCSGQSSQQAAASTEFSGDRIKTDVAFLADDKLEGRFTGSPGYMMGAKYVADRFAELGLTPGNNGQWYQQVPFAEGKRKQAEPSFVRIGDQEFANGGDVVMAANAAYPDYKVDNVEAVFVGYGIDGPEIGSNDYAGVDVRGKIAVVLYPFPKGAPSETAAHMLNEKAAMARKHGAIGLLSIHTPAREKVIKWELMGDRANQPDVKWIGEDGKPRYPGDLAIAATLGPKAAEALFAGEATPLSQIYAEMDKQGGKPKGFALKKRISLERHSDVRRMESPNVLGILEGSDPTLKNEYIVLSAHLDALGRVKEENGDTIVNGAMDNAMGVSTMLEVARAFAKDGKRPKRSILFAALTGEEQGLLGAEYLAKYPVVKGGKVVGLVNLDMPIVTYDFEDLVAFGADHSTVSEAVARAAKSEGIRLSPDPEPEQVAFVRTDHYPFVKAGVPAVSLDIGPAGPGSKATETFIANNYHRVSDDMKLPFNWAAAAKFAKINYLVARDLADAADAPRWYEGDYFGEQFAKGATKAKRQ